MQLQALHFVCTIPGQLTSFSCTITHFAFSQDLPHLLAMDRPPDVAVVSLSKYDGIYQLNSLILTGAIAVVSKWAIQFLQLKVASGSWFWLQVWLLAETAMTWVGSFAFRRG